MTGNAYRPVVSPYREPVQQSLTVDTADYTVSYHHFRPVLGIILAVYPADDPNNPSALGQSDQRGFCAMAKVLVIQSGSSSMQILDNVVITPDRPMGMDNYVESLPTPTTALIDGTPFNEQLFEVDPMMLNGDRCIVSWLTGAADMPFVLRWWPHQRNTTDPQTSGRGNPGNNGEGTTLNQRGRVYSRVNGVEQTVTPRGDILINTNLANSTVAPQEGVVEGRVARAQREGGGSIKAWIRPSQSFELDWNRPVPGYGANDSIDPSLPQRNTPVGRAGIPSRTSAYLRMTQDNFYLKVPKIANVEVGEELLITSGGTATVDAESTITLSTAAGVSVSCLTMDTVADTSVAVRTDGTASFQASTFAVTAPTTTFTSTASFTIASPEIAFEGIVRLSGIAAFQGVYLSSFVNSRLLGILTTTLGPEFDAALDPVKITKLKLAFQEVISAFNSGVSPVVFV